METWRVIPGFAAYECSSEGRFRSWHKRERKWRNPQIGRAEPLYLGGYKMPLGYVVLTVRGSDSIPKRHLAHRLIALTFLGKPPTKEHTDVAHNDGDPANNRVSNLRWALHRDNQMDMRLHGTMQDGERSVTCKITEEIAQRIRERAQVRGQGRKLAREFGLSVAQISRIKNGHRWRSL